MNKYALNIDTKQLKKKISYINNFNNKYTFLDHMDLDNISIYYDILNNIEEYKLKNIYNFIYKRINYLDKNNNLIFLNIKDNINSNNFNIYLNDYINKDIIKSIFIINSIQQYYYPIKF